MIYDSATITPTSGSIPGTTQYGVPDDDNRGRNRIDKNHAATNRDDNNGRSVMLTITIDPNKIFTLGVSQFTVSAVAWGIHLGSFTEGTEWMSPTGRVRIMDGKLKYTSNKALYPLPKLREGKYERATA
jgi:hypothetical protein